MKKVYIILGSILIIAIIFGSSFAFFNYTKVGENNVFNTGDFYINFLEGEDSSLSLTNTFPTSSFKARESDSNTLSFHVVGENTIDDTIKYDIVINNGEDINGKTRFNTRDLRFDLIRVVNGDEIYLARNKMFETLNNSVLYSGTLRKEDGEVNDEYLIRMWLSDDAVISDTAIGNHVYTTDDFINRYANIKVALMAEDDRATSGKNHHYMSSFPSFVNTNKLDIVEVYFDELTSISETEYESATNKETVTYTDHGEVKYWFTETDKNGQTKYILHVGSQGITYITNANSLFSGWQNVETIEFNNVDTSLVTSMENMFLNCSSLSNLDLSSFDTKNVTTMEGMFSGCENLESINLSTFDTSKVLSMENMFLNCENLQSLNLINFMTSSVTNMSGMFSGVDSIETLDLSMFDVQNVTDMSRMFYSSNNSKLLEELNLDGWVTTSLVNSSEMFRGCSSITNLDLRGFDTNALTTFTDMFRDCTLLEKIYVTLSWDTSSITVSGNDLMFDGDTNLVGGKGTAYNSNNVSSSYARIDNPNTEPGYFTYKEII